MKVVLLSLALLAPALPVRAEGVFFRNLQAWAEHGEAESQFILGLACCDGWEGSIKSGSVAAQWCDLAAEVDDLRPQLVLGLLQREEARVTKDQAQAVRWLNQAATRGDDYACVILGEMMLEGIGVPANWRGGTEWIKKSADTGFGPAQFRLGVIYMVGDKSTPKNEIEALAWFIVAADSGSKLAQEFRDERTHALGREDVRLAIERSRTLLALPKGLHKGRGLRDTDQQRAASVGQDARS